MSKYPTSCRVEAERLIWLTVDGAAAHHGGDGMAASHVAHVVTKHLENWKLSSAENLRACPWQVPGAEHMSLCGTSHTQTTIHSLFSC